MGQFTEYVQNPGPVSPKRMKFGDVIASSVLQQLLYCCAVAAVVFSKFPNLSWNPSLPLPTQCKLPTNKINGEDETCVIKLVLLKILNIKKAVNKPFPQVIMSGSGQTQCPIEDCELQFRQN